MRGFAAGLVFRESIVGCYNARSCLRTCVVAAYPSRCMGEHNEKDEREVSELCAPAPGEQHAQKYCATPCVDSPGFLVSNV